MFFVKGPGLLERRDSFYRSLVAELPAKRFLLLRVLVNPLPRPVFIILACGTLNPKP